MDSKNGNWFEKYGTMAALFAGLVIVAGAIYFGHGLQPAQQTGTDPKPTVAVDSKSVKTTGEPVVGDANAPVTMAVFLDFQCPYCQVFDQEVLSQVYTNYVQTGKVKLVLKDFDFIGPDSLTASEYSHAVWDLYPAKYYEWYTAMFAAQDEENGGFGDEASVKKLTGTISGIDAEKVAAQVKQKKSAYQGAIEANFEEGKSYGIQGTPSVIIGKTLLQGNQTYQKISTLLDAELKK